MCQKRCFRGVQPKTGEGEMPFWTTQPDEVSSPGLRSSEKWTRGCDSTMDKERRMKQQSRIAAMQDNGAGGMYAIHVVQSRQACCTSATTMYRSTGQVHKCKGRSSSNEVPSQEGVNSK